MNRILQHRVYISPYMDCSANAGVIYGIFIMK